MPAAATGKFAARRAALADRIADILLARGLAAMPLRDLAQLLGTSDRMLLYYFATQSGLTAAALSCLSQRLSRHLDKALPAGRLPPPQLLKTLCAVLARPDIARILRVWADVTARGARGEAPFRDFARASVTGWLAWTAARLDVAGEARRGRTAAAMLAAIEGMRSLELSAPGATRGVPQLLAKAFA
jgi:AcrR family transcriptional regulator